MRGDDLSFINFCLKILIAGKRWRELRSFQDDCLLVRDGRKCNVINFKKQRR